MPTERPPDHGPDEPYVPPDLTRPFEYQGWWVRVNQRMNVAFGCFIALLGVAAATVWPLLNGAAPVWWWILCGFLVALGVLNAAYSLVASSDADGTFTRGQHEGGYIFEMRKCDDGRWRVAKMTVFSENARNPLFQS